MINLQPSSEPGVDPTSSPESDGVPGAARALASLGLGGQKSQGEEEARGQILRAVLNVKGSPRWVLDCFTSPYAGLHQPRLMSPHPQLSPAPAAVCESVPESQPLAKSEKHLLWASSQLAETLSWLHRVLPLQVEPAHSARVQRCPPVPRISIRGPRITSQLL